MSDATIVAVTGRRVWDSRGRPTAEAEVHLADGAVGRAIAPAGASTGAGEALDRRDGGPAFGGLGVTGAVRAVREEIAKTLVGRDGADQAGIDETLILLDGTPTKSRLGGNAIVAVSMAVLQAAAASRAVPVWRLLAADATVRLPMPMIQIFGGGAHAARRIDIQDFLVLCPRAESFDHALAMSAEIYRAAGLLMAEAGLLQGVADEGGFWPAFDSDEAALDMLVRAIERAGLRPGVEVFIALDVAASELGSGGRYRLGREDRVYDRAGLAALFSSWLGRYPIVSIEDPFGEDDGAGFRAFTAAVGKRCQVVGDDLLVSCAERVVEAARTGTATAVLLKPNQAGTVSEMRSALEAARRNGLATIVSARSGESEDVTIAHLAVGWDAGQFKVGAFARSERMAKWNEVLRIEEALGDEARYAGGEAMVPRLAP